MIVEDQREVSRLLSSALVTLEHQLEIVEMPSGEEAILDATSNPVDLLVADYLLPGISGIQLMKKIRDFHPDTRVILMTGLADPLVRREVALAGADAFFIKPISIADFLDSVERLLGLVETILPLEPILQEDGSEDERQGLADLLTGLRLQAGAQALLLLNDRGRVLACAGELPDKNHEVSLVGALMAIYSASQKVSQVIGSQVKSNFHIFTDGNYELIFIPVNSTHAILLVGKDLTTNERLSENIRFCSVAIPAIEASLQVLDGPVIPFIRKATPVLAESEQTPHLPGADLEPLLTAEKSKLRTDELNDFWSEAATGQPAAPARADDLSYDQASKLGLVPPDDQH